jgi:hypothetical protein
MNTNGNKIPNVHKILPKALKYINISHLRPSKIFPNWDFWFIKKPSGNPDMYVFVLELF